MNDVRESILKRISECETVVNSISSSPAWEVVVKDLTEQRELLDNAWQDLPDDKLPKARELKHSCVYVLNLKPRYEEELATRKRELELIDHPENEIAKDYDNETEIENG